MEFGVLGPLRVRDGEHVLAFRPPRVRALLGVLLINAGGLVGVDTLVDELWPADPPPDARGLVHGYVSRLRRALRGGPSGAAAAARLVTRKPGYLLVVADGELDLHRFDELLAQARAARLAGDLGRAVDEYRRALGLWRGDPFADAPPTPVISGAALRLAELRLQSQEELYDAVLDAGDSAAIVAELTGLAATHPVRERLVGQLMLALHRSGRTADALDLYQRTRTRLREELGVDPGPALREVELAVLRGTDPAPPAPAPATRPVPQQLPADIPSFTGRAAEVGALHALLRAPEPAGPVVVSAIQGTGGVGKSALAVHVAHQLAGEFPGGQLYADLLGSTAGLTAADSLEVLGRFLRALGVPGAEVPSQLAEAAARFRTEAAGRRLLVLLDNAADEAQVRPLLPGTPGCAVVVTSRRPLAALSGATPLPLDVLGPAEAVELLARLAGRARVAADPEAAALVARRCGYLPLALRIAGARLAARPAWSMAVLAERLAGENHRLDELEVADIGVRASFAVSYQELETSADPADRAAAGAFARLGWWICPDFSVPVAAALLGDGAVEPLLERLVDARLLESPAPGRYRLHDLMRLYAAELAATLRPADQIEAVTRATRFYTATAWRSLSLIRPGDSRLRLAGERWTEGGAPLADRASAVAWMAAERENVLAVVAHAAATPAIGAAASQLAHALFGFFLVRGLWRDLVRVNETAVAAASERGEVASHAQAHVDLAGAAEMRGAYTTALRHLEQALALQRSLGDRRGEGASLTNLIGVNVRMHRLTEALECGERALVINREVGERNAEAIALSNLGLVYKELDRLDEAADAYRLSVQIGRSLGNDNATGNGLSNLSTIHRMTGRYAEAMECARESLAIRREMGDWRAEGDSLVNIGAIHHELGRYDEAGECFARGLAVLRELGAGYLEAEALRRYGTTLHAQGRPADARDRWQAALEMYERLGSPLADEVRALLAGTPAGSG
ncbi:BTAD domain-containing putative transcriptional regulator [Phytohabitans sp. ZYX-F-186]|uniref:BTAD domain-containing putative transcriptional regulator n=1 Tax=Phytohabitans maris TaxID=3071409 RepID=A0ABU0ZRT0_9ACTN|nr:BTAD domain-containing putative transcriptional regulator [Phytohabitans sp. ZYX-F-186]MDQ7909733.1 BTAD domain-containing putative transcriptional regulator [Phytohabitans sp. ZYX-F-186]